MGMSTREIITTERTPSMRASTLSAMFANRSIDLCPLHTALRAEGLLEVIRFHTRLILNGDESSLLD